MAVGKLYATLELEIIIAPFHSASRGPIIMCITARDEEHLACCCCRRRPPSAPIYALSQSAPNQPQTGLKLSFPGAVVSLLLTNTEKRSFARLNVHAHTLLWDDDHQLQVQTHGLGDSLLSVDDVENIELTGSAVATRCVWFESVIRCRHCT